MSAYHVLATVLCPGGMAANKELIFNLTFGVRSQKKTFISFTKFLKDMSMTSQFSEQG